MADRGAVFARDLGDAGPRTAGSTPDGLLRLSAGSYDPPAPALVRFPCTSAETRSERACAGRDGHGLDRLPAEPCGEALCESLPPLALTTPFRKGAGAEGGPPQGSWQGRHAAGGSRPPAAAGALQDPSAGEFYREPSWKAGVMIIARGGNGARGFPPAAAWGAGQLQRAGSFCLTCSRQGLVHPRERAAGIQVRQVLGRWGEIVRFEPWRRFHP